MTKKTTHAHLQPPQKRPNWFSQPLQKVITFIDDDAASMPASEGANYSYNTANLIIIDGNSCLPRRIVKNRLKFEKSSKNGIKIK